MTPFHYVGTVWCIRIPSGAFVARRNGKVFVTGNSGFPKGKGCLKPAYEPIILARRPGPKVLPLGIEECRVPTEETTRRTNASVMRWSGGWGSDGESYQTGTDTGRYPANVLHDGSDEVTETFPDAPGQIAPSVEDGDWQGNAVYGKMRRGGPHHRPRQEESKSAARFFYCAKASKSDRDAGNTHPTVKPTELMRWLVRLVCPPGGVVLDPFAGSGTTGKACVAENRHCVLIEREAEYVEIIKSRLKPANTLFD